MPRSTMQFRFLLLIALCTGLCVLLGLPAPAQEAGPPAEREAEQAATAAAPGGGPSGMAALLALEETLVDVIAKSERSVVSIARVKKAAGSRQTARLDPNLIQPLDIPFVDPATPPNDPTNPDFIPNEFGTGVVIGADGLILTNYHVLDIGSDTENEYYVTTIDRRPYKAQIKAADPRSDLAVLKIDATDLTPITLGNAKALKKGQIVITLGNPYAIARDGQVSAGWGIVSNLARKAGPVADEESAAAKPTLHHYGTLIQTDAKLNLGTSGGPLLNLKGEMVGLTTSLAALAGYEQAAGYAIPVDDVFLRIVEQLKEGREVEYGFLGVRPENLEREEVLAGAQGARIISVVKGAPADRFGIQKGDVVVAVDGQPIYDVDGLMLHIGKLPVETPARLLLVRNGRTDSVEVEVSKYGVQGKKVITAPSKAWRGVRVDYATVLSTDLKWQRANGMSLSLLEPALLAGCVAVIEVADESPAHRAGLRRGALLTHVGNTHVESPRDFYAAVAPLDGPVQVRLSVEPGARGALTIDADAAP